MVITLHLEKDLLYRWPGSLEAMAYVKHLVYGRRLVQQMEIFISHLFNDFEG